MFLRFVKPAMYERAYKVMPEPMDTLETVIFSHGYRRTIRGEIRTFGGTSITIGRHCGIFAASGSRGVRI